MVTYAGVQPSTRLLDLRHHVLRVTFEKGAALTALNVARWPQRQITMLDALNEVIERGAPPYASPIGDPSAEVGDRQGVIDYLPRADAGAGTVGDLARVLEEDSSLMSVVRIADAGTVPTAARGGAETVDRQRDEELDRARAQAASETVTAKLSRFFGGVASSWQLPVAVIVVAMLLIVLFKFGGKSK